MSCRYPGLYVGSCVSSVQVPQTCRLCRNRTLFSVSDYTRDAVVLLLALVFSVSLNTRSAPPLSLPGSFPAFRLGHLTIAKRSLETIKISLMKCRATLISLLWTTYIKFDLRIARRTRKASLVQCYCTVPLYGVINHDVFRENPQVRVSHLP